MTKKLRIIIAAAAVVVAATLVTVWLTRPSYEDHVEACQRALATQSEDGGKGKPSACDEVKKDDYDALVFSNAINGLGWVGKDGKFDKNKMLESPGN